MSIKFWIKIANNLSDNYSNRNFLSVNFKLNIWKISQIHYIKYLKLNNHGKGKIKLGKSNFWLNKDFSHNWNILKNINSNDFENIETRNENPETFVINNYEKESDSNYISNKNDDCLINNLSFNFNYIRNLVIIIDMSESMNSNDLKPTRFKFFLSKIESLISNFYKYNFISNITIVCIKNYTAEIIGSILNEPFSINQKLGIEYEPEGYPSLFNALHVFNILS